MNCRLFHVLWLISILLLGNSCTSSTKNEKKAISNANLIEQLSDSLFKGSVGIVTPDSISGFYGTYSSTLLDTMTVSPGLSLTELLQNHLPYNAILRLEKPQYAGVPPLKSVYPGQQFAVLKDSTGEVTHVFVERDALSYYAYEIYWEDVVGEVIEIPTTTRAKELGGVIKSSLWATIENQGSNGALSVKLANIFAWSINFYRIQANDTIRVLFDEVVAQNGKVLDADNVTAVKFTHFGKPYYAFAYGDSISGFQYFDERGHTMKQMFLQAPVEFSRISSRFTHSRRHPVTGRNTPHLGTDYAAPTGTPILSTANGVIETFGYTSGNGNYVKVKHNSTYSTQYLHMSKFADGLTRGAPVQQGQIIGYVGSTGLSTGPHVCYRFWKNGVQIDPYTEIGKESLPMPTNQIQDYLEYIQPLKAKLDAIEIQ